MKNLPSFVDVHEDVLNALAHNKPVVAFESTIITHGMPFPDNVEMALAVEDEIRQRGALPATIAVKDGRLKIGLTKDELDELAQVKDALKISRAGNVGRFDTGVPCASQVIKSQLVTHDE